MGVQLGQNVFNGVVISGIYLLIALGLTVVFGLTRLINFAHGQLLVVGTFVAFTLTAHGQPCYLGLLAASAVTAVTALALERGLFRWTLSNPLNGLIIGLGALTAGQVIVTKIWSQTPVDVAPQFRGGFDVAGVRFSYDRVVAVIVAVFITVGFSLLITQTKIGRQMRATREDPLAAAHMGINVSRVITFAFVIGSAAAGAAGAVLGTLFPISPFDGGNLILKGFAVALLGGLGNVLGAVVASVIYGVGETLIAGYWDPQWVQVYTFGIIVAILLVRPGGLFGMHAASQSDVFEARTTRSRRPALHVPYPLKVAFVVAVIAFIPVVFSWLPTFRLQGLFISAAISTVLVYSLSILYHQAGMLSAAHGALMGIGAYAAGLLALHLHWSFWATLAPAFLFAAFAGALLGIPVARAKGHYFVLLTFAFGALIVVLMQNLTGITRGDQGVTILNAPQSIGPLSFKTPTDMFHLCYAFAVATGLVVWGLTTSTFGRRLAAIRDSEPLALSLGLPVGLYKVLAFGISGGIAGIGGVLYLYQNSIIVPESFAVLASFSFIIMLVLGGRGLLGPPAGVLLLTLLPEFFHLDPQTQQLVYALALITVILVLPRGVVPSIGSAVNFVASPLTKRSMRGEQAARPEFDTASREPAA